MQKYLIIVLLALFVNKQVVSQNVTYNPEILLGHRAYNYQHKVGSELNQYFTITNIVVYDTEYDKDRKAIYFLRNTVSYNFHKHFSIAIGLGLKNPGAFTTISGGYNFKSKDFSLVYALGTTYQNHFTLETFLLVEYTPKIGNTLYGLIKFQVSGNFKIDNYQINLKEFERGIQQFRLGLNKGNGQFGFAANFDQFSNSNISLFNLGIFYKHNF
ncbi:hypothetical protein ATE92_2717 [Ulvibacter sp. MAR_2010_11]|uniref:hypothetical protein n=1 Tax=Ulvibacter sp. MAR_2010_11 TaxID=1250229 RepID=UPI000C2B58DF|nr:hypothetical protein [Ulvibacter sp. MAR_2010_11]PKA84522.1 hypothetical protein ATE92_2717 [Ulvibacter sp. MAR_2010_11]